MQKTVHKKDKIYYTMGEVSEMFDVNQSLLRYWEQEFEILKPQRNKKGNRLFTPKDVETVRIIYHLVKERKMKIEIARQYIRTNRENAKFEAELTERLLNIRSMLLEIKYDLLDEGEMIEDSADEDTELRTAAVSDNTNDEYLAADTSEEVPAPASEAEPLHEEERQEAEPASRPAFEEQMLFDIAVPMELLQKDEEIIDDGYESAKAGFHGTSLDKDENDTPTPEPESGNRPVEQTLF